MQKNFFTHKKRAVILLLLLGALPPLGYFTAIQTSKLLDIDLVQARTVPYRDNAWYFMWPPKNGNSAPRQYATEALHAVDKNAILIADYTLWRPLYFMQAVEKMRPDVELVWVEHVMWKGPIVDYLNTLDCKQSVYLATNTPPQYCQLHDVQKHYRIKQIGIVFRIEKSCLK